MEGVGENDSKRQYHGAMHDVPFDLKVLTLWIYVFAFLRKLVGTTAEGSITVQCMTWQSSLAASCCTSYIFSQQCLIPASIAAGMMAV